MILFLLVTAMGVSLFVLQEYVNTGTHSRTHRLLPLILGLIGLTDFYQIVEYISKDTQIIVRLEDLLQIQMLYLLIQYMLDILRMRLSKVTGNFLFISLIAIDVVMFLEYGHSETYELLYYFFVFCYIGIMLFLATYAYYNYSHSRNEQRVNLMLYLAVLVPSIALIIKNYIPAYWDEVIIPVTLMFTCGIVYYLMVTQQLVDPMTLMQENMYDTSDIGIILFDEDYYYLDANEAARNLFPEQLSVLSQKNSDKSCADNLEDVIANKEEFTEFWLKDRGYFQCFLTPVVYNKRLKGYILSIMDITRQKEETQLMEQLKKEAEEQTLLKSRFLACMSHDLRSPLHAIIGISDIMLGQHEISGRNYSLMCYVRSAGNTLLELVNSILLFSKLESRKLELAKSRYDLEKMLEDLANMCIINLQNKPVHFTAAVLTEHPAMLIGDGIRVREMLQNMLSNAVKYTQQGEIRCELTCTREEDKYRISCTVADTGPGMSKEQLAHIFDEYSSFSGGRSLEGTGLGLSIVKQLAELMGGTATAQSDGKNGSAICVTFYQEEAWGCAMCPPISFSKESLLRKNIGNIGIPTPTWVYPGACVLLADDMQVNQEIFKGLVRPWKLEVDTVVSGQEAVLAADRKNYQIIFLDMMMADLTGVETAAAIRRKHDTPLVLVTAALSDDIRNSYRRKGFQAFLEKPIEIELLQNILENLIPDRFREKPDVFVEETGYEGNYKGYRRMLEAFVREVKPLVKELPDYADKNHALFQTKVHGIKGASLQIGKKALSESAEIMEMAAKTDNFTFVDSHLENFIAELENALQEVIHELSNMPVQTDTVVPFREGQDMEKVYASLLEGFSTYNISQIEEGLRMLETAQLTDEQAALLEKLKTAYYNLEYEEGAGLLNSRKIRELE